MRTEEEMLDLILKVAKEDQRVRMVGLNGSRTNSHAPKDIFQDYDIVYLVSEIDSFLEEEQWVDVFGERIIMQTPEDMAMFPPQLGARFSYLMLFTDHNRIDLMLIPMEEKEVYLKEDGLIEVLLDKDEPSRKLAPPTDEEYWVKKPSDAFYQDCCNEFWWVTTYVAKGLYRKEILYAQEHLNQIVRSMLLKMLSWKVGVETDFSLSVGKSYKYLERYVDDDTWQKIMKTFATGNYEEVWRALFVTCELFRETALFVGESLQYTYAKKEDESVFAYLNYVYELEK
ncbi:aminoglycoside 6-adenylyltransferase [Alkalihalobacillus sp. 1P02AB]|uniref:aminoglycoside 6-adenylyltransferase n=1 Tax=Alkalihalobacillus sp. 1P02AB TaxID=3132260 RepID=UPI0039A5A8C6